MRGADAVGNLADEGAESDCGSTTVGCDGGTLGGWPKPFADSERRPTASCCSSCSKNADDKDAREDDGAEPELGPLTVNVGADVLDGEVRECSISGGGIGRFPGGYIGGGVDGDDDIDEELEEVNPLVGALVVFSMVIGAAGVDAAPAP